MRTLWRGIVRTIFWSFDRGSWPYDLMVVAIVLFVLLTPRSLFHDQPQTILLASADVQLLSEDRDNQLRTYRLDAKILQPEKRVKQPTPELERETHDILSRAVDDLKERTFQVTRIDPLRAPDGSVVYYDVTVHLLAERFAYSLPYSRNTEPASRPMHLIQCAIMARDFNRDFESSWGNLLIVRRIKLMASVCFALCVIGVGGWTVAAQGRGPWTLDSVLRQLDVQDKTFHSLSADVERTKVTVVVNDHSTETGTLLVRNDKMLLQMKSPDVRTVLRTGDNLYVYTPGLNRVEEYNLGKNRAMVDQFLLLGFGSSGKELQKSYLVTLLGEPMLNDKKTVELELTPKSSDVRNQISKIQIWFDQSSWLPIQQQFNETGSGDYFTIRYSKVVRNPTISESEFKPHWPKGTDKVRPQG